MRHEARIVDERLAGATESSNRTLVARPEESQLRVVRDAPIRIGFSGFLPAVRDPLIRIGFGVCSSRRRRPSESNRPEQLDLRFAVSRRFGCDFDASQGRELAQTKPPRLEAEAA
jgi:hypothetical protein